MFTVINPFTYNCFFFLIWLLGLMVMFFLFAKLMVMLLLQLLCKNLGDISLQMLVPWMSIQLSL